MTKEEREQEIKRLTEIKKKAEYDAQLQEVQQHAYKIFLNSVYGFTGTQYSPVFNKDIAEGVTLTGQSAIKEMSKYVNSVLNDLVPGTSEDAHWVIAGDTDSVARDSIIIVDGKEMTISEAFDNLGGRTDYLMNGTEVKVFPEMMRTTDSINGNTEIKNISRHLVNKDLWKVKLPNGKELTLTEDHSIMVYRKGIGLIEARPSELTDSDFFIAQNE